MSPDQPANSETVPSLAEPEATVALARLRGIRHVALDMDGTIYRGAALFESTVPFLELLGRLGIGFTFLTNNPTKSLADYLAHLHKLGLPVAPGQLYTSTQATIEYLQAQWPQVRRLFVLGTQSMCAEVAAAGFELLPDDPGAAPDAVLVGFDTTLTYARLCRAAWWIAQGRPWFGTNPDRVCPTNLPTVLVDCGSICAALRTATGRPPTAVLGKPDPAMLHGILRRHRLPPAQLAMVGDRLYTDIEMARRAGAFGVLVLTGETSAADAARTSPPPDLVVPTLAELGRLLAGAQKSP
jgi:NagD protein